MSAAQITTENVSENSTAALQGDGQDFAGIKPPKAKARRKLKREPQPCPPLLADLPEPSAPIVAAVENLEGLLDIFEAMGANRSAAEEATREGDEATEAAFAALDAKWQALLRQVRNDAADAVIDAPISSAADLYAKVTAYLRSQALLDSNGWRVYEPLDALDILEAGDDIGALHAVVGAILLDLPKLANPPAPVIDHAAEHYLRVRAIESYIGHHGEPEGDDAEARSAAETVAEDGLYAEPPASMKGVSVRLGALIGHYWLERYGDWDCPSSLEKQAATLANIARPAVSELIDPASEEDREDAMFRALAFLHEGVAKLAAAPAPGPATTPCPVAALIPDFAAGLLADSDNADAEHAARQRGETEAADQFEAAQMRAYDTRDEFEVRVSKLQATSAEGAMLQLAFANRMADLVRGNLNQVDRDAYHSVFEDLMKSAFNAFADVIPQKVWSYYVGGYHPAEPRPAVEPTPQAAFDAERQAYLALRDVQIRLDDQYEAIVDRIDIEAPAPAILCRPEHEGRHYLSADFIRFDPSLDDATRAEALAAFEEWWPRREAFFDFVGGAEHLSRQAELAHGRVCDALMTYLQHPAPTLDALRLQMEDAITFDVLPGLSTDINDPVAFKAMLQDNDEASTNYVAIFYQQVLRLTGGSSPILAERRTWIDTDVLAEVAQ